MYKDQVKLQFRNIEDIFQQTIIKEFTVHILLTLTMIPFGISIKSFNKEVSL